MKTAYVNFWNGDSGEYFGKEYAYKTNLDLKEGDFAVVKTPVMVHGSLCASIIRGGLSEVKPLEKYRVVKVVRVENFEDKKATKFIVSKVDVSEYEKRIADEKKKQELLVEMEKLAESSSKLRTYELLAEADPEMRALLDAYKAI